MSVVLEGFWPELRISKASAGVPKGRKIKCSGQRLLKVRSSVARPYQQISISLFLLSRKQTPGGIIDFPRKAVQCPQTRSGHGGAVDRRVLSRQGVRIRGNGRDAAIRRKRPLHWRRTAREGQYSTDGCSVTRRHRDRADSATARYHAGAGRRHALQGVSQ